jgi:hypothetical protein
MKKGVKFEKNKTIWFLYVIENQIVEKKFFDLQSAVNQRVTGSSPV